MEMYWPFWSRCRGPTALARLGPGASETSEDVEFARRLRQKGFQIGYMREAIVYHSVDPMRLPEDYFKIHHKQQGRKPCAHERQRNWTYFL
jgi:hypothetical protein